MKVIKSIKSVDEFKLGQQMGEVLVNVLHENDLDMKDYQLLNLLASKVNGDAILTIRDIKSQVQKELQTNLGKSEIR